MKRKRKIWSALDKSWVKQELIYEQMLIGALFSVA
jgi:hypothetical protein